MSTASRVQSSYDRRDPSRFAGFTLIELLVVLAVIAILAGLLLPVMSKAKAKGQGVFCLNNTKQLCLAWGLYADDHSGRLPYNLGGSTGARKIAPRTRLNWVNNNLDWFLDPDNTNASTITDASLGDYASMSLAIYKCPSDHIVSSAQADAGWSGRIRSYSMNAMVGDAGEVSKSGANLNNPDYIQFFSASQIPEPARIFVFLDEHPDSINDGYFLNQADYTGAYGSADAWWIDLPASYHNGAASFSFADGHSEMHRWIYARTKRAPIPNSVRLPMFVPANERADFDWVISRMSVDKD